MYCKNCGAKIDDHAKFCSVCGAEQELDQRNTVQPTTSIPQTDEEIINDFDGNVYAASKYLHLRDGISMSEARKRIRAAKPIKTTGNNAQDRFNSTLKKALIVGAALIFVLFIIKIVGSSVCFHHHWEDATCLKPITCSKCGKQKGEALGHVWVDATCTQARHCSRCNQTFGKALDHDVDFSVVQAATCTKEGKQEGVCKRCNEQVTEDIPKKAHTPSGQWEITAKATLTDLMGMRVQYCTVCGEIAKEETYTLTEAEKLAALKDACKTYSYKEIARNPDAYAGKYAYFKGEVTQVVQDETATEHAVYRVSVTHNGYFWTDAVMVIFEGKMTDDSRLIEDDVVKMYGKLDGMYTYETVMGDSLTIPLFRAQHIERVN